MSRKVLIVEDEELIATAFEALLTDLDYSVVVARDLERGRILAEAGDFRFALVDLLLPGGSSIEIGKILKRRQLPFAFMTGAQDRLDELGDQLVLTKPFRMAELERLMRELESKWEAGPSVPM